MSNKVIGVTVFGNFSGGTTCFFMRKGVEAGYRNASLASLDRLSRVVGKAAAYGRVNVRPFRSGLGWVATEA